MADKQNSEVIDKAGTSGAGEIGDASSEPTFVEKMKTFGALALNSHALVGNFLTLFDERYESELPPNLIDERNRAEQVIFWSSVGGRIFAVSHVARKLSILNGFPFNPIRDGGVLFVALGALFLCDTVPISYYFPRFEPALIKRFEKKQITKDLYAETELNQFKVWYYTALY